jgi:hypothetical protein
MRNYDAANENAEYVQCAVCEKAIKGGNWFARIRHGDWLVALCCPLCTETFERNPASYIHRIETLAMLESKNSIFKQDDPPDR